MTKGTKLSFRILYLPFNMFNSSNTLNVEMEITKQQSIVYFIKKIIITTV